MGLFRFNLGARWPKVVGPNLDSVALGSDVCVRSFLHMFPPFSQTDDNRFVFDRGLGWL